MPTLRYSRTEPQTVRRGFPWRYRAQLFTTDSEGELVPQSLNGFTITPEITLTESKGSTAAPGVTITSGVVSEESGRFDTYLLPATNVNLVVGKSYTWRVFVSHPTITSGLPFLVRDGLIEVPA